MTVSQAAYDAFHSLVRLAPTHLPDPTLGCKAASPLEPPHPSVLVSGPQFILADPLFLQLSQAAFSRVTLSWNAICSSRPPPQQS